LIDPWLVVGDEVVINHEEVRKQSKVKAKRENPTKTHKKPKL